MRRPLIAIALAGSLVAATLPYARESGADFASKLSKAAFARSGPKRKTSPLVGLDLSRIDVRDPHPKLRRRLGEL